MSNDYLLLSSLGLRPESQGVVLATHMYLEAFINFTRINGSGKSQHSLLLLLLSRFSHVQLCVTP